MRKLREAALVATMVGSISMLGAGVASAGGHEEEPPPPTTIICNQSADASTTTTQTGLVNINGPIAGGGSADSGAVQQICGIDNDNNTNDAGSSTGGEGGAAGIAVTLLEALPVI